MLIRLVAALLSFVLALNTLGVEAQDSQVISGNENALADNIIITIDDCSIESNVRALFHMLQKQGLTATFFPIMRHIKTQEPQLWRDIVAAGFDIGYHTRLHIRDMSSDQLEQDFPLFQDEVRQILGDPNYTIRYVRPPAGLWNDRWLSWANAHNLITVKWNAAAPEISLDLFAGILHNREQGGSILILHTSLSDVEWLQNNLSALMVLQTTAGQPYHIESLTTALDD